MKTCKRPFLSRAVLSLTATAGMIAAGTANASVHDDFSRCAAAAMETQNITTKKINVNLPSDRSALMDHNASPKVREYVMDMLNPRTGENYGKFSCLLTTEGEVTAINYLSQI